MVVVTFSNNILATSAVNSKTNIPSNLNYDAKCVPMEMCPEEKYRKTSYTRHTLVGNKIVDHSDVFVT